MESNEKEFYCYLKKAIDVDMFKNGLKVDDLIGKSYIISRQTYFNIQGICKGNKNVARISFTKMNKLCTHLGINIKEIKYVYEPI